IMSNRKSKLLQSLEESMQPLDDDDVVRLIAHQIRHPLSDPVVLSRGKNADLSILHLEDAIKFRESMENFNISPTAETIDEVMPVKDQQLGEILDVLNDIEPEQDDDDDDEDDDDDDDDGEEDDDGDYAAEDDEEDENVDDEET
ncbi:hypothetical protein KR038_001179, partial [Drosophila bunnanda]